MSKRRTDDIAPLTDDAKADLRAHGLFTQAVKCPEELDLVPPYLLEALQVAAKLRSELNELRKENRKLKYQY